MDGNDRFGVVDEKILEGYRLLQDDGEPDVVTEFIDTFLSDLPARLAAIEAAVTSEQPTALRSAAHALKGSAATIGAPHLSELCSQLETMGKANDTSRAAELWSRAKAEAVAACQKLVTLRDPAIPLQAELPS
jgi:HPt (histidine-containing phosphotransfer) domain-containing protein